MPGQVCLIGEAGRGGDVRGGGAGEQEAAGPIDAASGQITVRWQAEPLAETPHEIRGMRAERARCFGEGQRFGQPRIQEIAKIVRETADRRRRHGRTSQVDVQPFRDQRQSALGFERVRAILQGFVQLVNPDAENAVGETGVIDRGPDQVLAQHGCFEVEHALAETMAGRGPSVVGDVLRASAA